MTTTSYHGGSNFSEISLYDGWGDTCDELADDEATYRKLGDLVVERFHDIAKENNSTAHWVPYTSEVIHDIDEADELLEQYDDWRIEAQTTVGEDWEDGLIDPVMSEG